jgi:hypothetical protein
MQANNMVDATITENDSLEKYTARRGSTGELVRPNTEKLIKKI